MATILQTAQRLQYASAASPLHTTAQRLQYASAASPVHITAQRMQYAVSDLPPASGFLGSFVSTGHVAGGTL
jgi:hypothetical protein